MDACDSFLLLQHKLFWILLGPLGSKLTTSSQEVSDSQLSFDMSLRCDLDDDMQVKESPIQALFGATVKETPGEKIFTLPMIIPNNWIYMNVSLYDIGLWTQASN